MLYDASLICGVGICTWLALDVVMVEGWRRRSIPIGLLGGFGALWTGSELLLRVASEPAQLALCRRLLYLGVAGVTFSWFWVAVQADAPRWWRRGRWMIGLAALPLAVIHSCLYWAPDGLLISLHSPTPQHGPLYLVAAAISWILITTGLFHYGRAALRLSRMSVLRTAALASGVLIPLVSNVIYSIWMSPGIDPSPVFLGFSALMIRFAVIDPGLSSYLPLARSDIIDQLAVGVIVTDVDNRVIDANAAARQILGIDRLEGRSLPELTSHLDGTIETISFPLHSHMAATGTAVVLTDRRDAIQAEQRLQLAARLEAVGSLTAGIAHEVNNPLAYVRSNLNFIEKLIADLNEPHTHSQLPDASQHLVTDAAESIAEARDGIERISLLVARMRGFTQEPAEGVDCAELDLLQVTSKAAAVAGVGLPQEAIQIRGGLSETALGNEHAVVQILVNLILNAIQASEEEPRVEIEISSAGNDAEIRVSDRGCGLDEDSLDRVFDPFFTSKPSGSGLGLSISFDMASRLGGRIEAANRPGGGAAFSLFLPRIMPEMQSHAPQADPGSQ